MFTNNVGGGTGDSIERTDDAIERYVPLCNLDPSLVVLVVQVTVTVTVAGASINHGRTMDETWTIHGQLASILAAQRLHHALSRKRCAARSIGVHERPWHINVPKSHFYEFIF